MACADLLEMSRTPVHLISDAFASVQPRSLQPGKKVTALRLLGARTQNKPAGVIGVQARHAFKDEKKAVVKSIETAIVAVNAISERRLCRFHKPSMRFNKIPDLPKPSAPPSICMSPGPLSHRMTSWIADSAPFIHASGPHRFANCSRSFDALLARYATNQKHVNQYPNTKATKSDQLDDSKQRLPDIEAVNAKPAKPGVKAKCQNRVLFPFRKYRRKIRAPIMRYTRINRHELSCVSLAIHEFLQKKRVMAILAQHQFTQMGWIQTRLLLSWSQKTEQ